MRPNLFRPPQNRDEMMTEAFIRIRDTASAAVNSGGKHAGNYLRTLRAKVENAERIYRGESSELAANRGRRGAGRASVAQRPNRAQYYVFEMRKGHPTEPLRKVNTRPLDLVPAKQLARIGAQKGVHARTVTRSPQSQAFRRPTYYYEAGTGEKRSYSAT